MGKNRLRHIHGTGNIGWRMAYYFYDGHEDFQDGIHQWLCCRPEFIHRHLYGDIPPSAGQYDSRRIRFHHGHRVGRTGPRRPLGRSPQHAPGLGHYDSHQCLYFCCYLSGSEPVIS